jgi:type IV pilus assembly protein PilO
MKLSQREKILLSVLGIFIFCWLYYTFAFVPQYDAYQETEIRLTELQKKVEDIELYNDPNGAIQKKYEESEATIAKATGKYFPEILQERQIRIVDQMLIASVLKGEVLTFSEIAPAPVLARVDEKEEKKKASEEIKPFLLQDLAKKMNPEERTDEKQKAFSGNGIVETLETQVEFIGSYQQFINFIKAIETYPKKILISNIYISKENSGSTSAPAAAGELTGTVTLQFYGIPKMHPDQDQDYNTWDIYDVYGRANPYLP